MFDFVCDVGYQCSGIPDPLPKFFLSFMDSQLHLHFVKLAQLFVCREGSVKWLFKLYMISFNGSISHKSQRKLQLCLKYYIKNVLRSREATVLHINQTNILSIFNSKVSLNFESHTPLFS